MGEVFGQILPIAVGVALSPVPVSRSDPDALHRDGAKGNSIAFVAGWILGLTAVGRRRRAGPGELHRPGERR